MIGKQSVLECEEQELGTIDKEKGRDIATVKLLQYSYLSINHYKTLTEKSPVYTGTVNTINNVYGYIVKKNNDLS